MRRSRWRFYETASGAKPVQAFLDNLTPTEAAEVVAAMREVAREGEGSTRRSFHSRKSILNKISNGPPIETNRRPRTLHR